MTAVLAPLQLSNFAAAEAPTPAPALAELDSLVAIFPAIERDVLAAVLEYHNGNMESAVGSLLELSSSEGVQGGEDAQLELDAQLAHRAQLEMDEEAARALAQQLEAESRMVSSRTATATSVAASTAASTAASGARSLLARVRSAGRRGRTEGTVRLLDSEEIDSSAPLVDTSPLDPTYSPPQIPAVQPPVPGSPPSTMPIDAAPVQYSSRVDRARAANLARGATTRIQLVPRSAAEVAAPEATILASSGPAEGTLI